MAAYPERLAVVESPSFVEQSRQSAPTKLAISTRIKIVVLDSRVEESNIRLLDIAEQRAQGRQTLWLEISAAGYLTTTKRNAV